MAAREVDGSPRYGAQGRQQRAREYGRVRGRTHLGGERVSPGPGRGGFEQPGRVGFDEVVVWPQYLGQGPEALDDPRVEVAGNDRQQIEAQAVAQVVPRAVGVVGAPADPTCAEPGLDLGAPGEEQRVHEPSGVTRGWDAPEAGEARARQKAHQQGLGLVLRRMPERDDRASAFREAEHESEPHFAGEFLHRCQAPLPRGEGVPTAEVQAQIAGPRQRRHGRGVAIRPATAQPVIEMGDLEGDSEALPDPEQQVEQAGRVGAAGDRGDDPRAGGDEPVAGVEPKKTWEQRRGRCGQAALLVSGKDPGVVHRRVKNAVPYVRNCERVFFRCPESCAKESTISFMRVTTAVVSRAVV